MRLTMVGLNHRTANVEMREKAALQGARLDGLIEQFRHRHPHAELLILSTCNRTELYAAHEGKDSLTAESLRALHAHSCGMPPEELTEFTINRENEQAVAHLFHVACGLESMVLGEFEIVGQIRRAYESANGREMIGPVLHNVFQTALATSKQVRTQTGIDAGRISIASVAVDFARQIFDQFNDKFVLGIGAGDMTKLMLKQLAALSPRSLCLANRTVSRARELAEQLALTDIHPEVRALDDLPTLLVEADIVVTSTGSDDPIITETLYSPLIRKRHGRPLFILDIAVPRDVAPKVGSLRNVYLYNIDDLQEIVSQTQGQRQQHVASAEQIIARKVRHCVSQIQHRDVGQLIRELRHRLADMGEAETQRTLRKFATASDDQAEQLLNEHTHRLINKILHMPLSQLDTKNNNEAPLGFYAAALRRLFDLDTKPAGDGNEPLAGESADTQEGDDEHEPTATKIHIPSDIADPSHLPSKT